MIVIVFFFFLKFYCYSILLSVTAQNKEQFINNTLLGNSQLIVFPQ